MDDDTFQQGDSQDELSEEDRAILRAFEAMDLSSLHVPASQSLNERRDAPSVPDTPEVEVDNVLHIDELPARYLPDQALESEPPSADDMLAIFIGEVGEDLLTMRRALPRFESLFSEGQLPTREQVSEELLPLRDADLRVLSRTAHKIKGTAGAMYCNALATLALYLEMLAQQIAGSVIGPFVGWQALSQTLHALETTLESLAASGKESHVPLAELQDALQALDIDFTTQHGLVQSLTPSQPPSVSQERVDGLRLQELVRHSEQLISSSASLEHAQTTVERALIELQAAHERLRRLEASFSAHFLNSISQEAQRQDSGERPASSLVARIIDETLQRTGHLYVRKNQQLSQSTPLHENFPWDELEIDRFKGSALHVHSLSEAIADVATASSQLRIAYAQLTGILQKQMAQISKLRDNTLLLRLQQTATSGGTSFHLRFPRSHGAIRVLLLRVGNHSMAAPLFQVQRVITSLRDFLSHESNSLTAEHMPPIYALSHLLGLSEQPPSLTTASVSHSPVYLQLSQDEQQGNSQQQPLYMLEIDEVSGDAELVVQPLAAHLRRLGIAGTAIDGVGNVILVLDLPELIRHHDLLHYTKHASYRHINERSPQYATPEKRTVLIADDSVYMRQSLRHTLERGGYHVLEAHDGVEALQTLLQQTTDILILDLEMPDLNGYEVLRLIRHEPTLAALKIVIMTARSSDKHYERAGELGAHAYLTKPSSPEILLKILQDLLETEMRATP
jgi:CheY-like chemotaxis protein/chemotaxis protein histidine kinase CheA